MLSWGADRVFGKVPAYDDGAVQVAAHFRVDFSKVESGRRGSAGPTLHWPDFKFSAVLLVLPAVIALVAENIGHVKAVGEMTGTDVDPYVGRAIAADGIATVVTSAVGGSPTTTYAENIGVMAATKVYSTAAYYIAAVIAIVFGLIPKFGALVVGHAGRRAGRRHGHPVRHDRPARREDLDREPGGFRRPGQHGPDRRGHHPGDRTGEALDQRRLQAGGHRARHHRGGRRVAPAARDRRGGPAEAASDGSDAG